MTKAEWAFVAACEMLAHAPASSFGEASEVARELQVAWPSLDARDAVACYFAPFDHLLSGSAVELR